MRLLVTNTQTSQAYDVIRCLRPYADHIVATMDRPLSYAAYSRFVDARYKIPTPNTDWQSGNISRINTQAEQKYFTALIRICNKERIDTIYPSRDPDVFVCSKNKQALEDQGILTPVPELDVLLQVLDKGKTIELAQKVGFPCPKTVLGSDGINISDVQRAFGPPWVIKPRTSSGSTGMAIVTDSKKLEDVLSHVRDRYGDPLIQEYIPGAQRQNFYVMVDADGDIYYTVCPKIIRHRRRIYRDSTAAALSSTAHPWMMKVHDVVRNLNWRGALTFQTKIDARDGVPKLMEINGSIRAHTWRLVALGINPPLLCVKAARNEKLPLADSIASDILFLDPIQDLSGFVPEVADRLIFKVRTSLLGKKPTDRLNVPSSFSELFSAYWDNYLSKNQKAYHPRVLR